jgi:hypothetical protein
MLTSVIAAVRPWDSTDSGAFLVGITGRWIRPDFESYDDQKQIEMCLECPFADDCHECVTRARRRRWLLKRKRVDG